MSRPKKLKLSSTITSERGIQDDKTNATSRFFVEETEDVPPTTEPKRATNMHSSWKIEAVQKPKNNRIKKIKGEKDKPVRKPFFKKKQKKESSGIILVNENREKWGIFSFKRDKTPEVSPLQSGAI